MRTLPAILTSLTLVVSVAVARTDAAETARATVSVNVQIASRTSLRISSNLMSFDVLEPGGVATATIDFSARARVPLGADVVLTVESPQNVLGPGGPADADTSVTFAGVGDGLVPGTLAGDAPSVAGRWHGSGRREGRLLFTIRANATGQYVVPVRFVLTTP